MSDGERQAVSAAPPADGAVTRPPDEAADQQEPLAAHGQAPGEAEGQGSDGTHDIVALAESDPRSRAELLAELVEAEARRDEYLDDLRRARAEFENYRRRVLREGATQRDAGREQVIESLLEVLDDLERTLQAAEGAADATIAKGVELVASKLVGALQGVGLERIDAAGIAFDPKQHEAVQQQPAEQPGGEPVVVQVLRPGYRLGERILRAAMVVVEQ